MDDAIQIDNRWYIPATSSRADDRTRVLKSDDGFAVFSRHGEIGRVGLGDQGFYFLGTRHLSRWQVLVAGREPMLLNSTVRLDNSRLVVDQTTPDLFRHHQLWIAKGTLHLRREQATHESSLTEHLRVSNYSQTAHDFQIEYGFGADFRDIFEVRGERRARRGEFLPPEIEKQAVVLGYEGLDGVTRRTRIEFSQAPASLSQDVARFAVSLAPGESFELEAIVSCANGKPYFCISRHAAALRSIDLKVAAGHAARASIFTDNEQFNDWLNRSVADLQMLTAQTRFGLYPYAGVPWFSTPFGRDGLVTALQTLWLQPDLARGVLAFLAATQATTLDPAFEAEPGKILHELREGEMAALGEVPFRRYYGTVDATPLFVMLAGRYYQRTGDIEFIRGIWSNLERALGWIEARSDSRGFLTYARNGSRGLLHQGWKDSDDAVFHRDGRPAQPPIALCEVQGYVYDAFLQGAELAGRLGQEAPARGWRERAARLRQSLEEAFWIESLETYALALDGEGRRCEVRTSNPAHLLYCGVVSRERAVRLARHLTGPQGYNGWGLRTVFAGEPNYNPMSYHNGSVWPHDTALAAAGLARYGLLAEALTLLDGLFNASIFLDMHRLPELFCGFERLPGQAPTLYPVACAPQAWASGAVFMLLEAILGLEFEPDGSRICLRHPCLPDYISWLRITGLRHGDAVVDLAVRRHTRDVAVNIERREGEVDLTVIL
ncbi:amylo-alpha-1,6-glucosidase [Thiocystis violascens]|uniref:amylo-alpha-1,6-glucosidase n=1 Tax=Thiocystis violascens TaxID=73141 RepID=UPI0012F68898|nr:amylo-alpha-1,6-glucosidase [Thiocystis violascens]